MTRDPSVFVHEKGLCESEDVGPRTRIWAFAHVMAGAVVGADCNVGDHAFIESGAIVGNGVTVKNNVLIWDRVTIEDDVFLGPNAVFTNDRNPRAAVKKGSEDLVPTRVRKGATVGANATVVCGVTIGENAFVGAGALVSSDVPAFALVVGNPARRRAWVCVCGERLPTELRCSCGRRYRERIGVLEPIVSSEVVAAAVQPEPGA
jgi:UDP-2-acetamido-3-amino-2,3-dideoxy-glucuronate N-acetyltransferase